MYTLGVDGLSAPMLLLSVFTTLAYSGSFTVQERIGNTTVFLLLETGMLGVFLSLDFLFVLRVLKVGLVLCSC